MARVAITLGDPRGIGPEVVEKALETPPPDVDLVAIGPDELVRDLSIDGIGIGSMDDARDQAGGSPSGKSIVDPFFGAQAVIPSSGTGKLTPAGAGMLAGRAVERAARMALDGQVDAIVTAPAEKYALNLAGFKYPGHTEWLAHLAGDVDVAMMLVAEKLRVVLVTTHLPLREVPDALTTDLIIRIGEVTRTAFRSRFGIAEPRLAICALNPHAGESSLFGSEDRDIIGPAAARLGATGPISADTVFVRCIKGEFDAVLAPYHDVGMTAIKVASFGTAVNITLGLPFVRTAPDHGTAMDIAGKGVADHGSMQAALNLAARLALRGERASGAVA